MFALGSLPDVIKLVEMIAIYERSWSNFGALKLKVGNKILKPCDCIDNFCPNTSAWTHRFVAMSSHSQSASSRLELMNCEFQIRFSKSRTLGVKRQKSVELFIWWRKREMFRVFYFQYGEFNKTKTETVWAIKLSALQIRFFSKADFLHFWPFIKVKLKI